MALLDIAALLFLGGAVMEAATNSLEVAEEVPGLGWTPAGTLVALGIVLGILGVITDFGLGKLVGSAIALGAYFVVAGHYLQQKEDRAEELREQAYEDPDGMREELDELLELLGETDDEIQSTAATAIGNLAAAYPQAVTRELVGLFEEAQSTPSLLDPTMTALNGAIDHTEPAELPAVLDRLADAHPFMLVTATSALIDRARSEPDAIAPVLPRVIELLDADDPALQNNAALVIAAVAMADPDAARPALEALERFLMLDEYETTPEPSAPFRELGIEEYPADINRTKAASRALAGIGAAYPADIAEFAGRFRELLSVESTRIDAVRALGEIATVEPGAVEAVAEQLEAFCAEREELLLRIEAARTLARTGPGGRATAERTLRPLLEATGFAAAADDKFELLSGPRVSQSDILMGYLTTDLVTRAAGDAMAAQVDEDVEVDEEALEELSEERFAEWIDSVVQVEAARTLAEIADDGSTIDAVVEHLVSVITERSVSLDDDRAAEVLAEIAIDHPDAVEPAVLPLMDVAGDEEATTSVRLEACRALGHVGAERALETLRDVAADPDAEDRLRGAAETAREQIEAGLERPGDEPASAAANSGEDSDAESGDEEAPSADEPAEPESTPASGGDPADRLLEQLRGGGEDPLDAIESAADDEFDPDRRETVIDSLIEALEADEPAVQAAAARALGELGAEQAMEDLDRLRLAANPAVSQAAADARSRIEAAEE